MKIAIYVLGGLAGHFVILMAVGMFTGRRPIARWPTRRHNAASIEVASAQAGGHRQVSRWRNSVSSRRRLKLSPSSAMIILRVVNLGAVQGS